MPLHVERRGLQSSVLEETHRICGMLSEFKVHRTILKIYKKAKRENKEPKKRHW